MSQPASFTEPREGETVLACPHEWRWKAEAIYIGHVADGKPSGLGVLVKSAGGNQIYVRWVLLCWWCRLWRKLKRQPPLKRARREMTIIRWGE